jgi:hypothetical protein
MALPTHQHCFECVRLFQRPAHYGPLVCTPSNFLHFKICHLGHLMLGFRSQALVLAPARFSLAPLICLLVLLINVLALLIVYVEHIIF